MSCEHTQLNRRFIFVTRRRKNKLFRHLRVIYARNLLHSQNPIDDPISNDTKFMWEIASSAFQSNKCAFIIQAWIYFGGEPKPIFKHSTEMHHFEFVWRDNVQRLGIWIFQKMYTKKRSFPFLNSSKVKGHQFKRVFTWSCVN